MMLSAIGLILAAAAADTSEPPNVLAYRQCVEATAAQFEKSGESAAVVADAAMAACVRFRFQILKDAGPTTDQARELEEQILGALDARIRGEALVAIVRERAARNGAGR
jgi:hypothetical protein